MFDKLVTVFTPTQFRMGEKGVVSVIATASAEVVSGERPGALRRDRAIGPKSSDLLVNLFMRRRGCCAPARRRRSGSSRATRFATRSRRASTVATGSAGYDFVRGLFEFAKKGEDYQQFLNSGAGNAAMVGMDRNRLRRSSEDEGDDRARASGFADSVLQPDRTCCGPSAKRWSTRRGSASSSAASSRKAAPPEGYARAALAARDVTIDFARGGSVSEGDQPLHRVLQRRRAGHGAPRRSVPKDPVGATRATTAITVPTLALYALNRTTPPIASCRTGSATPTGTSRSAPAPGHSWARVPKPFSLGQVFGERAGGGARVSRQEADPRR
jgi:hypothetical protein